MRTFDTIRTLNIHKLEARENTASVKMKFDTNISQMNYSFPSQTPIRNMNSNLEYEMPAFCNLAAASSA